MSGLCIVAVVMILFLSVLRANTVLVNSDCELKICDMGLSRGYDSKKREDEPGGLTEYVATRWYRGKYNVKVGVLIIHRVAHSSFLHLVL